MEATNISIKQQSSVSINVETLQEIKQRGLQRANVGVWTLPRIYRRQIKAYRRMAAAIDAHTTLSNIAIGLQIAAGAVAIFMYA